MKKILTAVILLAAAQCLLAGELADVYFTREYGPIGVHRWFEQAPTPADVVRSVMLGPNGDEMEDGIFSVVPVNWVLDSVTENGAYLDINMKPVPEGTLYETGFIEDVCEQFDLSVRYKFGLAPRIFLGSEPLESFEVPAPDFSCDKPFIPKDERIKSAASGPLSGRLIAVRGGHGWAYDTSRKTWVTERGDNCAQYITREDFHTLDLTNILITYLEQEGADIVHCREGNKERGNCQYSGKPWWQMAPMAFMADKGYPSDLYGGSAYTDVSQSRYAASNLANYRGADLYLSVHTNAISGDCYSNCGTGIEAFWSSNNSSSGSQRIAQLCVDNCISMVRNYYDSSFACRWGCKAQDKNYAETRRATMPSVLFEFGFHDNCAKDAKYLGDNFFRTVGMYGLAKAVYDYYGITPKWGPFSAEYISDTIPATVRPGETKQVSITFKNHGLCWQTAEGFKLVDVNSGATKALPGEIMPGETCTFTFNMTFPSTAGTHTVKWRMRRDEDGVGLFGDTLTKNVKVINPEKDSQCTANNIPTSIKVGETRNVTLTFKNTGTKPWIKADGFRLGWGSDESDPFTTTGRVQLPGDIAPGQSVTFTIPMTFNKVGTFTTDWQMLHENVEWFGDVASTTVNVHPPMDNAQIISSTIPSSVRVGETRNVTFTIKNTGDTTWTWASGYHLCFGSDGTDPFCSSWGELGQEVSVAPGQTTEITVAMNFTKMGTFTTDWQMIHGDSRFGNTHSKSVTVTTDKVNGAEIISSTIPSTATLGETRNVTFTVKNTGTTTWSWDGGYHLCFGADQSDPFATRWGELGNGVMLAPGQTATITVSMTFGQAGTFTTDWQMTQDGVGRFGNVHSKSVTVSAPSATDNAEITGHTIPSTATVGETKDVTFTIKNTGTSSWTWAEDYHLCFGNDGTDPFCSSWGDFGQEVTVAPGQTATITVRMTFDKAGTFTSDWQMIHGGTRFGNSVSKSVTVTAPSGNNAEILSNTIPSSVNVGETRNVTFTVKNTGTTTWSWEAGYHLYFGEDAYDPFASAWGELGDGVTVAPGATATITVPMTFSSPGTYTTDWQMIQDGKGRFGNTVSKSVTVNGGVGTYYVDANSGNDSNNGLSPSTAWKTLKKASDNAANGGTNLASGSYVIVKGGTYTANERGGFFFRNPGVTYKADGNVKVTNSAGYGDTQYNWGLQILADNVTVDGFEVYNVVGCIDMDNAKNVTIKNCTLHGTKQSGTNPSGVGVYIENGSTATVTGCTIYGINRKDGGSIAAGIYNMSGYNGESTSSSTYTRNVIRDVQGAGIYIRGTGSNDKVYNNSMLRVTYGVYLNKDGGNANGTATVKNNVFVDIYDQTANNAWSNPLWSQYEGKFTNDYNLYANNAGLHNASMGAHDISTGGDSVYNNKSADDMTLAYGSAAIDTGTAISGVTDGYKGSAPDMGAFESNYNCVISGTVSSSAGGAVSGAKVAVGSVSSTTGSDGKYTLTLPRAASYTLSVTASGYDSQTATVDASGSTATKNFTLSPSRCVISGTVSSSEGAVSGATVKIGSSTATTGSDGRYSFSLPQAASYSITVTASGYDSQTASVAATGTAVTKNFTLARSSCSVSGTVTAGGGGAIAGAKVTVGNTTATTDEMGSYNLSVVRNGSQTITVSVPGYTGQSSTVDTSGASATKNFALVRGTEFFVNSETGDDAKDGLTADTAWKTITGNKSVLAPGDVVNVTGSFGSAVFENINGSADKPITFRTSEGAVVSAGNGNDAVGFLFKNSSNLVLKGFRFTENFLGAVFGGKVNAGNDCSNIRLTECLFDNNHRSGGNGEGAAIWIGSGSGMMIDHCRFVGNGVADEGCIVIGNKVNGDNYVYHNVFDSNVFGLRVWGQGQPVHVANNIFTGNTGAALYGDWDARNTHLYNNCFYDNNEIYAWIDTIAGNCWTDHGGNIEADPMFVDNTIYEVGELSPVIDAGCMLGFDYDGNAPDIGCFESLYTAIDYGFVTGVVTDDATGAPIAGAAVTIGESTAITDENGEYSLTASGGQVEITVTAEGYADESGTASVVLRETTEKDFALTAAYTVIDNMADLDEAETGEYVKVTFDAKAVTSAGDFADGSLYIESGLFAGYKLILPENADINAGDTFTFMGVVRSDSGGKYVEVASVTPKGSGEAPRPVGMTNSMLFTNALVRVWGKVVALGNGSAVITGGADNITILLEGNDAPAMGEFIVVTGIASPGGVRAIEIIN